jgi:hypothetical protein
MPCVATVQLARARNMNSKCLKSLCVPIEACSEKVCGRVSDRKRRTWPELDHTSLRGKMDADNLPSVATEVGIVWRHQLT